MKGQQEYIYTYSIWINEVALRGKPEGKAFCTFMRGYHARGEVVMTERDFNYNRELLERLGLRLAEIDRRLNEDDDPREIVY